MNTTNIDKSCPYCGNNHSGVCPRVKSIEYFPDGTIKKVDFKIPADEFAPQHIHQAPIISTPLTSDPFGHKAIC